MSAENQVKILVIDDDGTILMQVEQILKKNGYTPVCANDGEIGLEKAISEHPDAIILDRKMPKMDGNETLMQLKANDLTKNVPVIMLTGDNRVTDISTSLDLGAVDYIVKPFDQDNFLVRLERALKQSNAK